MIVTDIKGLIEKLNTVSTKIMYEAGGLAVSRANYEVAPEHFLLKSLEVKKSDIALALEHFKVDVAELSRRLNMSLEAFSSGNTGRPSFSPVLLDLLEAAWVLSSVDLKLPWIRTGTVLLAYLSRPGLFSQGGAPSGLTGISRDELRGKFHEILSASDEEAEPETAGTSGAGAAAAAPGAGGEDFIRKFCEDFTLKATEGKIDTVFGRDFEIRNVVDILARRRKNNPILVGNPGVGKTAVVEGLAKRISEGDVPEVLKGTRLVSLDLGLLEAGAGVKGEFERRLKGVIDQVKASPVPTILFIDEAHMLVGAGGASGGSDAANLLKPALARGELKTVAATTWKEYKKYFEKDAALSRRFQPVTLEEPSVESAILILRGVKESYEKSHGLLIRDEAVAAAAELSSRFITGRYLPDKAFDLLDTACARVKVGLASKPAPLEDAEKRIEALRREQAALSRDEDEPDPDPERDGQSVRERLRELDLEIETAEKERERLDALWREQKSAAERLKSAREALKKPRNPAAESPVAGEAAKEGKTEEALAGKLAESSPEDLKAALAEAGKAFRESLRGEPLIYLEVGRETVAKVVSDWTGIPVGKVAAGRAGIAEKMEESLKESVKGQDEALKAIAAVVRASAAGLKDPVKPSGVFLLAGPSGVGKTETALRTAELLFGDENGAIVINMNEFQEKYTVSRLIGSAPGYVGYGEGGLLTEAVSRKPYSVLLLDEAEKAHPDVLNLFYQVFDKGELSDAEGKKVSFSETVIFLTSNLGAEIITELCSEGREPSPEELLESLRPGLLTFFRPALLSRMTVVPFRPLTGEALQAICAAKLERLGRRLKNNGGMELETDEGVAALILKNAVDSGSGARNIDAVINQTLAAGLSREILSRMSRGERMPSKVRVGAGEAGDFSYVFAD
ncbi:MAG: type VI secretion system ATPase TssH [Deltaproteobacteria bacterium]|jgi:type VI secretion system protein VasG|nr:type VI secretion system ATPase TssH [Deltaproteobacteria bacterium]